MSIYFSVKYGYHSSTFDTKLSEWWEHEDFTADHVNKAKQRFDHLKTLPLSKDGIAPNELRLLLMGNYGLVLHTIDSHTYDENEYVTNVTLEDRPHKEVGKSRGVIPVPEGAWIVIEKSSETGEVGIIGAARTAAGAKKLMEISLPIMDDTRTLRVEYRSFIERTPNA